MKVFLIVILIALVTGCTSTVYTQRGDLCVEYSIAKVHQLRTAEIMTHDDVAGINKHEHLGERFIGAEQMKRCEFPVVACIPIYSDPTFRTRGIYRERGVIIGSHALVCTGYNEKKGVFEFVNSWGGLWGCGGYCWISEKKIKTVYGWEIL